MIDWQQALLNNSISKLPHAAVVVGETGSGRKTFLKLLAKHFSLEYVEIQEFLSYNKIEEIKGSFLPSLYVIDKAFLMDRDIGRLLKLFEEAPRHQFFWITCEDAVDLPYTILTRCQIYKMPIYSVSDLKNLFPDIPFDNFTGCLLSTPGLVKIWHTYNIAELRELCVKILTLASRASFSNLLSISNKVDFKNTVTEERYPIRLLAKALLISAVDLYTKGLISKKIFSNTQWLYNQCYVKNIDMQRVFEHYLGILKSDSSRA